MLLRNLATLIAASVLLTTSVGVGFANPAPSPSAGSAPRASPSVDSISIQALSSLGFNPSSFTVRPGDLVQLVVTQMANFPHSFVLSPLPNFTFDPAASDSNLTLFFRAHAPLVNLTLGSTVGSQAFANFTAPAVGSYEFVCTQPMHFQSGMHGQMVSSPTSSSSSSSSSTTWLIVIGVVLAVVVIAAVVLWMRRAKPPASPAPPATP